MLLSVTDLAKERLIDLESASASIEGLVCGELEEDSLQELSSTSITMRAAVGACDAYRRRE